MPWSAKYSDARCGPERTSLASGTRVLAEKVRRLLIDGGYDEADVHVLDTERVLKGTTADLKDLSPIIRALGSEGDMIRRHQASAAAGEAFLLAYAPSDLETQRVMNVARRNGYTDAHKYDRFTITKL